MNRRQALTGFAATAAVTALAGASSATASSRSGRFPTVIPLPDNWLPEGIAIGDEPIAYFGSRADGSIYRANLVTGQGRPLPTPGPGTPAVGLKIDDMNRLFVAGGNAGDGRVVDAGSGRILVNYPFTSGVTFINDVVLTPRAAFFTDSRSAVLFVVPIAADGSVPASDGFRRLDLTGDLVIIPDANNLNGIARTPDGSALLSINSATGQLFRINPRTGQTTLVTLAGGESLPNGDGLLLDGRTLYVVQNRLNLVAVVLMSRDGLSGVVRTRVGSDNFDVPTTVAKFEDRLYLPNARFGAVPPATTFTAVAIPVPRL